MELIGIHHLTAISAAIRENHRFYTQTLGMRLVKRSVNQDDVSAYHLFYADAVGLPTVLARVKQYRDTFGDYWKPAPLLEKLAAEGKGFNA